MTLTITDEMTETFRDYFYNNPGGAGDSPIQLALQAWVDHYFSTEPVFTAHREEPEAFWTMTHNQEQGFLDNVPDGVLNVAMYALITTKISPTEVHENK